MNNVQDHGISVSLTERNPFFPLKFGGRSACMVKLPLDDHMHGARRKEKAENRVKDCIGLDWMVRTQ